MTTTFNPAQLTRAQQIGQTLLIGFDGTTLTDELRAMITDYHIGGVILFRRNIASPAQVAALTADLQAVALAAGLPGLFIAIDQEGGRVARLTDECGFTEVPGAMAVAATGRLADASAIGTLLAHELRAVGINCNFAPVLDVNNNPHNPIIGTRSFGSDPATVAAYGVAMTQALQAAGVLAFGKHFPGHGDTDLNSHVDLPTVAHDRARLDAVELTPFRAAMGAEIAGIMSAHITFPAIEPAAGLPATLSRAVLTDLLRGELGYHGLLITDSLEMGALGAAGYPTPAAAVAALAAGADILLFNRGHDDHRAACAGLAAALDSGAIPAQRLAKSVGRILDAKARYGLITPTPSDQSVERVGSAAHRATAADVAQRSLTVLRDDGALLPLSGAALLQLPSAPSLAALGWTTLEAPSDLGPAGAAALIAQLAPGQPLIIGLCNVAQQPMEAALVSALLAADVPVVLVALRDPYDLLLFPTATTMLATYGANPPALHALATLLRGAAPPRGRAPIDLPGLLPRGAGLTSFTRER